MQRNNKDRRSIYVNQHVDKFEPRFTKRNRSRAEQKRKAIRDNEKGQ